MKEYLKPLFKLDSKGKVRLWYQKIEVNAVIEGGFQHMQIRTVHGLLMGTHTTKIRGIVGKNIGKSNETTSNIQAHSEAESDWKSQLDKGYVPMESAGITLTSVIKEGKTIPALSNGKIVVEYTTTNLNGFLLRMLNPVPTDAEGRILCMKLHHLRLPTYKKGSKDYKKSKELAFPCWIQPKVDGVCALVRRGVGLSTRGGKDRLTPKGDSWNDICPQIVKAVDTLGLPFTINGEVYSEGFTLQEITSACKKKYPLSEQLQLHIFDVVVDEPQGKRLEILMDIQNRIVQAGLGDVLKVVPSYNCYSMRELLQTEDTILKQGYEGIVVRLKYNKYQPGKRSAEVLKLVRLDKCEVRIIDIIPMIKEPKQGLFVVRYEFITETSNLREFVDFNLTPSCFNHVERMKFLEHKHDYIGKNVTIEHRGFTDSGVPRIAKALAFREQGT